MIRRRVLRSVAALLVAIGAVLLVWAPSAGAATLGGAGWWWRATELGDDAPKPPHVPEGGLYVAGTPEGAGAMSAVRFTLDKNERSPKLTLTVAKSDEQEQAPSTTLPAGIPEPPSQTRPVILACQTGSTWQPADGGKWTSHPDAACGIGKVFGDPSKDGSTWTWDLSSLQLKTKLDVVLVPGKIPGTPGEAPTNSTFEIAFEPPTDASLETTGGTAPAPLVPPGSGAGFVPTTAPLPVDSSSSGDASFDAAPADTGTDDYSDAGSFDPGVDTSDEGPALPKEDQGLSKDAPAMQTGNEVAAALPQPVAATSPRNNRLMGGLVLVTGLALALFTYRQPMPAPRKLGRFGAGTPATVVAAEPQTAGLGRFVRPRTGPAPRL